MMKSNSKIQRFAAHLQAPVVLTCMSFLLLELPMAVLSERITDGRQNAANTLPVVADCGKLDGTSEEECTSYYYSATLGDYQCAWARGNCNCGQTKLDWKKKPPPEPALFKPLLQHFPGKNFRLPQPFRRVQDAFKAKVFGNTPFKSLVPLHQLAVTGDVVDVVVDSYLNEEFWTMICDAIKRAESYVLISTYRLTESSGLALLRDALLKLDQGNRSVHVHAAVDDTLGATVDQLLNPEQKLQHVQVYGYSYNAAMAKFRDYIVAKVTGGNPKTRATPDPRSRPDREIKRISMRGSLHSKLFVMDGMEAVITGANVQKSVGHSIRDMAILLSGQVVHSLERSFWLTVNGRNVNRRKWISREPVSPRASRDGNMGGRAPMLVASCPENMGDVFANPQNVAFIQLLRTAEKSVFIYTPNLNAAAAKAEVPNAADRGIEVTIYLSLEFNDEREDAPGQGGNNVKATKELYKKVNHKGNLKVCWFTHQDSSYSVGLWKRSHVKFMSVDDSVAVIGSANWDTQAWYNSQEINIVVGDPQNTQNMVQMLRETTNSEQYCWPHHVPMPLQQARLRSMKPWATWSTAAEACGDVRPTERMTEDSEGFQYLKFKWFKKKFNYTLPRIGVLVHKWGTANEHQQLIHEMMEAVSARETLHLDCVWLVMGGGLNIGTPFTDLPLQFEALRIKTVDDSAKEIILSELARRHREANFVPLYGEDFLEKSNKPSARNSHVMALNGLKDWLPLVGMSGRPSGWSGNTVTRSQESDQILDTIIEDLELPVLAAPRAMVDPKLQAGVVPSKESRHSFGVYHADLMPLRTQAILRAVHAFLTQPVERVVLRHSGLEQVPNWMRNAIEHALLPYRSFLSVDFDNQQKGEAALRLLHYGSTDLDCPKVADGQLKAGAADTDAKTLTLIYLLPQQQIKPKDKGSHCDGKDERKEMPTLVPPDLPRAALRRKGVGSRGELPQYVFEACLEHGWEKCAPEPRTS